MASSQTEGYEELNCCLRLGSNDLTVTAAPMFWIRTQALTTIILIILMLTPIALVKTFPIMKAVAQVQSTDQPETLQNNGLLLQGVNATAPAEREEDIYSIPSGGDIYRITGEVFNNDTVRFSSVRVSATLIDSDGQTSGEGSAHTSPSGIQPGSEASFEINIFNTSVKGGISAISNFTLQVNGNRQVLTFK
ncbi:MAG: FxLYD domain-containing protein [Nitrososphaeraceae archaeon]